MAMPSCPHQALACLVVLSFAATAAAQAPPSPEHKIWKVAAGAGLALTSGNKETSNINAAYDIVYDPLTRNIVKSDGLMIRGKTDGELSANRIGLNVRDQYKLTERAFVFGQNQYLRDEFKNIDWLLAPGGGIGVKLFDSMQTRLSVDGGLAAVWEKNSGFDVRTSGAVTASEKLTQRITATTTITQGVTALWKTKD